MYVFQLAVMSCIATVSPMTETTTCRWDNRGLYLKQDTCEQTAAEAVGTVIAEFEYYPGQPRKISKVRCLPIPVDER